MSRWCLFGAATQATTPTVTTSMSWLTCSLSGAPAIARPKNGATLVFGLLAGVMLAGVTQEAA